MTIDELKEDFEEDYRSGHLEHDNLLCYIDKAVELERLRIVGVIDAFIKKNGYVRGEVSLHNTIRFNKEVILEELKKQIVNFGGIIYESKL